MLWNRVVGMAAADMLDQILVGHSQTHVGRKLEQLMAQSAVRENPWAGAHSPARLYRKAKLHDSSLPPTYSANDSPVCEDIASFS